MRGGFLLNPRGYQLFATQRDSSGPGGGNPDAWDATIEIDLAGKYRVRVSSGVDVQALRRVLDVLERR